jgi:hypothetical protein
MDAVFKKLNLKNQKTVVALNAPRSFDVNPDSIRDETLLTTTSDGLSEIDFILIFVTRQNEINDLIPKIASLLKDDAVLWMCYPKGTSKKYTCDFNRDTGWKIMGNYDLEPVRMVAIDEDWSSLRFKKADFIKTMTRSSLHALSEKGKVKSGQTTNSSTK